MVGKSACIINRQPFNPAIAMLFQSPISILQLLSYLLLLLVFHLAAAGQIKIEPRIIGGWPATKDRFSYFTSLLDVDGNHECGGSLIAPDIVLTAAHCQDVVTTAQVGRYNRSDTSESYDTFQVVQKYVHPKYIPGSYPYDFMLLKLSGSSSRQIISLNYNSSLPTSGEPLTVMGFGLTEQGNLTSMPVVLQQVTVNVIPNNICGQAQQRGIAQSYIGQITPDMLCAQDPGQDSCQGDSGGPLIIPGNAASQDIQVGHVSWGLGCAISAFPGVYARTSYGYDWIVPTLCTISSSPPSSVNCQDVAFTLSPAPSEPPTLSPAATSSLMQITVVIFLDDAPTETGWSVQNAVSGVFVMDVNCGAYNTSRETVVQTISLMGGSQYIFAIKDCFGDGLNSAGYRVVLGSSEYGKTVLVQGNGNFLFQTQQDFNLPSSSTAPVAPSATPAPSPNAQWEAIGGGGEHGTFTMTIEIQLDQKPDQTSWRLDSMDAYFLSEVVRVPSGSYETPYEVVRKTMELKAGRAYIVTFFDEGQDGIENGFVRLYSQVSDGSNASTLILNQQGDFGPGFQYVFDSSNESVVLPNSLSNGKKFLTLELQFDLYPNETGVVVEANDNNKIQTLFYRRPGYYHGVDYVNQVIKEYVVIPNNLSNATVFTFTILDTFSDGLCCAHNGNLPYSTGYTLYDGSDTDGVVIVASRFKGAPKEETSFSLPLEKDNGADTMTSTPDTGSIAIQVMIETDEYPELTGYSIQDASGRFIVNRGPGSFTEPNSVVNETIPLNTGVYYFNLVNGNAIGFSGSYQVLLLLPPPQGGLTRPPLVAGQGLPTTGQLRQAFIVEGAGASFFTAVLIETDRDPNQTGFYIERLDLNDTSALVAQVAVGSYESALSIEHEPLTVEEGGLYRLVMQDSAGDGVGGRIYLVLGGTGLTANTARAITLFGTSYESRGYYTFLARKDEPAYTPPDNARNLTFRIQFDNALPMGVDWVLLSDNSGIPVATGHSLQGQSLVAYGPQTPIITDYVGKEMVGTILAPQIQGFQSFRLSIYFRVNDLCCPQGLTGSFELFDDASQGGHCVSQGQFRDAQQATASFALSEAQQTAQSSAARIASRSSTWLLLLLLLSLLLIVVAG